MKEKQKQLIIDIMNDDAKDGLYKKQTAVEWLEEKLKLSIGDELNSLNGFFVLAKEMEKEQIINGRITAPITTGDIELDRQEAEHYYIQEYGNETTEKLE